ncbi:MAG: UDP-N-acetylmuramoyl-tripeptide--D-alanyl-D-alanine ligase [Rhodosalinus sp.]
MSLWTAAEAARATGGRATADWTATGVSIDTRTLAPGDLFVALTAARDGHDFVAQALEKGAAAALVSRVPEGVTQDAPLLIVQDVQTGLESLGAAARARTRARVVAVTGSVGKTSTKEMLRTVCAGQGRAHASVASYNNHWGVPLTLARMPADTELAVIEIGMNAPGEIAPLSAQARPEVAIVTTVAPAHLEAFGAIEGIAAEKASVVAGLAPGGTAILHGDLEVSGILEDAAWRAGAGRIVTFGEAPRNHHRLLRATIHDSTTVAEARAWRSPLLYKIAAPGRHFALNGLAVLAAAGALGLDRALAIADLGRWTPVAGRGARETVVLDPLNPGLAIDLIDEAYNANPASMAAALEVLAGAAVRDGVGRKAAGRRIAYLGDMKELGPEAPALHAALAVHPAMHAVDIVHTVGPLAKSLRKALPAAKRGRHTETAARMAEAVRRDLDAGDVVMVKGSLSTGLAAVVDAIRKLGHPASRSAPGDD